MSLPSGERPLLLAKANQLTYAAQIQIGVMLLIMGLLAVFAVLVLRSFRGRNTDDEPATSRMLTNFEELHGRGVLSDQEFRTIKTVLASKLHDELSNTGDEG
jgi:uncharacterized membrane protein